MTADENAALERELDMLLARAGAAVPPERRAGIVAGYRDMKRKVALLRQPRTAADETSNVYALTNLLRRT